jgi:two-component system cell cycle sensor histidine kinase/response regulator CckA
MSADNAATILIVDDEEPVRAVLARALRTSGFQVLEAMTGARAMDIAHQHGAPIDLVVTDMRMPGMDGRTLIDKLRLAYPTVRFLLMSGYTDRNRALAGLDDARVAYLAKPFTGAELADAVRELLGEPSDQ